MTYNSSWRLTEQQIGFLEMPPDPFGPTIIPVSDERLMKQVIWDVIPEDRLRATCEELGVTYDSDDVWDAERVAQHSRFVKITRLEPFLRLLSEQIAKATIAGMIVELGEEVRTNPHYSPEHFQRILFSCGVSLLAEMVDIGALKVQDAVDE